MTPEHLVDSAKLYDYYVNGFTDDSKTTHKARVHLSKVDSSSSTPAVLSAPSLMDLINADNVNPLDTAVDVAALENVWFNNPDPYDLDEVDRVDPALQQPPVSRSSDRFDISTYIKLDDPKLAALITKVDTAGPGVGLEKDSSKSVERVGKPGEWDIAMFLE